MSKPLHTLIIGAGQAGLAAAYYLKQSGKAFLLIDDHQRVGDNWRQRWNGLELFTPQRYNSLPGLEPKGSDWQLINRLEAADYLERYARHFSLPIQLDCTCVSARKQQGYWKVETTRGIYESNNIIIATGAYKDAFIPPKISATFPDGHKQLHSSEVNDVAKLVTDHPNILVIGAGASGQQISRLALGAGARVTLLGPKVNNLPREILGKDIYWWLYKSGAMTLPTNGFPGKYLVGEKKGIVTVGEPVVPADINRIASHLARYHNGQLELTCADKSPIKWPEKQGRSAVIWCTGYNNRYPFLPPRLLDKSGHPKHRAGISSVDNSVAYLGMENLRRPNSSLLGGVGRDAKEIVSCLLE